MQRDASTSTPDISKTQILPAYWLRCQRCVLVGPFWSVQPLTSANSFLTICFPKAGA
jgi:hypothetical protein